MASPKGYIKVDRGLLNGWKLDGGAWLVYCHLLAAATFTGSRADQGDTLSLGQTNISVSELAELTNLGRRTIILIKQRLADAGYITIEKRTSPKRDIITINSAKSAPLDSAKSAPSIVQNLHHNSAESAPSFPYIYSKNDSKNDIAKRARVREETAQNPQVQTTAPETPETTLEKWYQKFSDRAIAIEQYCVSRGVTPEVYHRCAAIAFSELELEGRTAESYRDYGDFSRHLQNRIRVKISSKEYESNSSNNQPGSREQRVAELYASFAARAAAGRHAGAGVFDT